MVAEIIINSSVRKLNKTFDYNIPQSMENDILVGSRVIIPFGVGENRTNLDGVVVSIKESSEYKLKNILKIKDEFVLSEFQIKLAFHIAKINFCNIYDVLNLMLPPGTGINRKKNIKSKIEKGVFLNKEFEEIELYIETGKINNPKHIRVLNSLKDNVGVTIPELMMISDTSRAVINTLLKKEYIVLEDIEIERNPFLNLNINRTLPLKLTSEQLDAVEKVDNLSIKTNIFKEFLLYGVTGSGKTEVYMQIIDKVISQDKTALVLVPEISLTPQMVERFTSRFGDVVSILHSKLSVR